MKNEEFSNKPLVKQIHDELFDSIERHDTFDDETIKSLKKLAEKGELKKSGKVTGAIKATVEKEDETA